MYHQHNKCFVAVLVLTVLFGLGNAEESQKHPGDAKRSLNRDCDNSYSLTCFKLDIVSWVDKLSEEDKYTVFPGLTLVSESSGRASSTADIVSELAREFPNDPEARLDMYLLKKVAGYFNSHSMRISLFDKDTAVSARKKDKYGLGLALAAGAMMKSMLFALALGGLALLSGKALMTGLISLLLSSVIGLKSLTSGSHKSTTYEIVSKPVYAHSASHSASHEAAAGGHYAYGRSFETPLPLSLQSGYSP